MWLLMIMNKDKMAATYGLRGDSILTATYGLRGDSI